MANHSPLHAIPHNFTVTPHPHPHALPLTPKPVNIPLILLPCMHRWWLTPVLEGGGSGCAATLRFRDAPLRSGWSAIAAHLPARTDNEIKNHWHTALKKRFEHKSDTTTSCGTGKAQVTKSKNHSSPVDEQNQLEIGSEENSVTDPHTYPLSPQPSSSEFSCTTTDTAATTPTINHENWVLEDDDLAFLDIAYVEPISSDFWTVPYLTDDISYVPPSEVIMQLQCEPEYFSPMNDVELWNYVGH